MKPLHLALSQWQPNVEAQGDPVLVLRSQWTAIVGPDIAANSRPSQIQGSSLVVLARSNAWSQQLSFLSERIVAAVRRHTGLSIERLRFRVGRVIAEEDVPVRRRAIARRKRDTRESPPTLEAAIARFKHDVTAAQRAKAAAGWKECSRCGVRIAPSTGTRCAPCENLRREERDARVARLLFEVPWLGYAGIAPLVDDLSPHEYQLIRTQLLRRWRDTLERLRRSGNAPTTRDRLIASSYVLLKSEVDPERIAPAVVRDLLGDELHELLYGNGN